MQEMTLTAHEADQYIPVSLATICPSEPTDFPLFISEGSGIPKRLFSEADLACKADALHQLIDQGIKTLYVTLEDHDRYQEYVRNTSFAILNDDNLPAKRRFGCLDEIVRNVLADVFAGRDTEKTVDTSKEIAFQTVNLICQEELMAADLVKVLHHDYHTFTHSANVAYYSVLLAKASGTIDRKELQEIATGALLHDVGKLDIDENILNKRGSLSREEWGVIRQHPTSGLRLLQHRDDLTNSQLMMVYQHHERGDGSGYPVGVSGDRIHPWAQLCAIVDVYEAITSYRPYRPGLSPEETISIMDQQAGDRLNKELWECWKTIILST